MRPREQLHNILVSIIGAGRVYFQPPEGTRIQYPCLIYSRSTVSSDFADNGRYGSRMRYEVTLISQKPETGYFNSILNLPFCSHNRHFVVDRLYHDVFNIYF